nr:hypothetical protein B0A51_02230 [Rachicladosporium sp. CCFEE 5018]
MISSADLSAYLDGMQSPDVVDRDGPLDSALRPRRIADTRTSFCHAFKQHTGVKPSKNDQPNFFKQAQFSPDGTAIVTHNADESLRTFVLPPDLLDSASQPHELQPYSTLPSATNVLSYAIYPGFNLADPSTTLILSAPSNLPLRLTNVLDPSHIPATYPYINSANEAFIAPNSASFIDRGTHFVAGSAGRVSVFDVTRQAGPEFYHNLKAKAGATGMRDTSRIMALSVSSDRLLAAGSTNRNVGIFGNSGRGACETTFSVAGRMSEATATKGSGVMSLAWTPDGKYLLVAERQSDGLHVYDVRNLLRRVTFLSGRNAKTTQRLGIDVMATREGCEVWAGGVDGVTRMWKNPGSTEGEHRFDAEIKMHDDPVSSVVWHPIVAVLATCSGQRSRGQVTAADEASSSASDNESHSDDEHPASRQSDNTLKIWDFMQPGS